MDKGRFAVPAAVTDWATALGVAALLLCTGLSGAHPGGQRELLGSVLLAAGGLALAARRRAPLVVLAVTGHARSAPWERGPKPSPSRI